jgi:hypothetical protein
MNRRKALIGISILAGGLSVTYLSRTFKLFSNPDFKTLDDNKILIDELVSTIIPATETPGAKEAGVGDFVVSLVKYCTNKQTQNKFITGLTELVEYTHRQYNKSFQECSIQERIRVLEYFESQVRASRNLVDKVQNRLLGEPFIVTLKKYTVIGYCTSEVGATQALAYDYIPGKFLGVVQLTPNQKAWAVN